MSLHGAESLRRRAVGMDVLQSVVGTLGSMSLVCSDF